MEPTAPGLPGPVDVGSELGSTKLPVRLVPGQADEIADSATDSNRIGVAARNAGDGLTKLTTSGWQGAAADKFREHFKGVPDRWQLLGEAMIEAAKALASHAEIVQSGQRKAQQAIGLWEDAKWLSLEHAKAVNAYNDRVDAYNDGDGPHPGPQPGPDPGEAKRAEAQRLVDEARAAVKASGDLAADTLRKWTARLPDIPGLADRLKISAEDSLDFVVDQVVDVHKGMYNGAFEMWKTGMEKSPITPGNMAHPKEYATHMAALAGNIVSAATNPRATVEHIVNTTWQKWSTGSLAFNVGELLPGMAAGMGAGHLMRGVKFLDILGDIGKATNKTPDTGHHNHTPNTRDTSETPGWQHPFGHFEFDGQGRSAWDVITDTVESGFGPVKDVVDDLVTDIKSGLDTPSSHHTNQPPPWRVDDIDDGWAGFDQPRGELSVPNTTPPAHHAEPPAPNPHVDRSEPTTADRDVTPNRSEPAHAENPPAKTDPATDHHGDEPAQDNPRSPESLEDRMRHDLDDSAANPNIDLSKLPDELHWRESRELLYRVDDRDESLVWDEGFPPKDPGNVDLKDYVTNNTPSAYVSTSVDEGIWLHQADRKYLYVIDAPGGIDVNKSVPQHMFQGQKEIAMLGGVHRDNVVGRYEIKIDPDSGLPELDRSSWSANPNYGKVKP